MRETTVVFDEPVLQRPRIVRWFADRPRIADVFVILACTVPTLAALFLSPPERAWLGYVCAAGVAIAFWWRRSHPLTVLVIVVALATLNPLSAHSLSPAFFESLFSAYAIASYTPLSRALLGGALGWVAMLAVSGLDLLLGFREEWPVVLLQPASLVAFALGIAARSSRSRRRAIDELVAVREDRAAAAERARITAEMHDVVAHSVTVMIALAGGAAAGWEKHPARARDALDQLSTVGANTLEEMQRILSVLRAHDEDLDRRLEVSGHNLPSLDELVSVFRSAGLPVSLSVDPAAADDPALSRDPALQTTMYRIVQEALTNALRHARDATFVEVEIGREADRLIVSVTDNGSGTAPGQSPGAGVGLRTMRERAAAFEGELAAGAIPTSAGAPGTGWRTRVSIPLGGDPV